MNSSCMLVHYLLPSYEAYTEFLVNGLRELESRLISPGKPAGSICSPCLRVALLNKTHTSQSSTGFFQVASPSPPERAAILRGVFLYLARTQITEKQLLSGRIFKFHKRVWVDGSTCAHSSTPAVKSHHLPTLEFGYARRQISILRRSKHQLAPVRHRVQTSALCHCQWPPPHDHSGACRDSEKERRCLIQRTVGYMVLTRACW